MQVGDLVKNNYNEMGVVIEEWGVNLHTDERHWHILYTDGNVEIISENALEVLNASR